MKESLPYLHGLNAMIDIRATKKLLSYQKCGEKECNVQKEKFRHKKAHTKHTREYAHGLQSKLWIKANVLRKCERKPSITLTKIYIINIKWIRYQVWDDNKI